MKQLVTSILLIICASIISGCDQQSGNQGFSLPIGDAENGRVLFTQHQCVECHALASSEKDELTIDGTTAIVLGGTSSRVQTYGDLVTSIINPSHRLAKGYPLEQISENGQSKMTYYNEVLTVEELVDLVTYLKSQYQFRGYSETNYPPYK